ncbi:MAG: von Willebrand factor type A domain-containing protein [Chitinophagales bacterium]
MRQLLPIIFFVLSFYSSILSAQNELPSNAQPGKCYAKCLIPDQYETITEQVLLKEAATRIEIIPAVYDTIEEQILEKEAYTVLNLVPVVFETRSEELLVKEASSRLIYQAPVFDTISEQVLVQPARTMWSKGRAIAGCLSANPEDCTTMCLTEIPAEYQTLTRQLLQKPATIEEIEIPAEYKTITKAVVKTSAQIVENTIPAVYRTIQKVIVKTPATTKVVEIPAEYSTVATRKLVRPGGFTDWVEVLCEAKITQTKVAEIQQALKARGYDVGAVDNVMGAKTKQALVEYQKKSGLPVGNLNIETMRSLGTDSGSPNIRYNSIPPPNSPPPSYPSIVAPNARPVPPPPLIAVEEVNTEQYDKITENGFEKSTEKPLSTFSIDVDKASYSNIRRFINGGQLPPKDAVRIEEMVNYFDYDYPQPTDEHPFSINTEMGKCPWNTDNYLLHIGLQGKDISLENIPANNLVFLLDVSGSMDSPNKLPLLKESLKMLARQMRPQDKVSVVVYAGAAGLVLPPTSGTDKLQIFDALDRLNAGGSTAGGAGIELAYKVAQEQLIQDGNNRVILATDGDFNVGISSDEALVELIENKRQTGIYLTVLGFGTGNYQDSKMEKLADKGNGNYAYIDNIMEAKKVLLNELSGTLFTIAKDVKIQVEFNPAKVASYRLIGYENRLLAAQDFQDDTKDAGEIGAGHTVTALYEIVPLKGKPKAKDLKVNPLQYEEAERKPTKFKQDEWVNIHFRYKPPTWDSSKLLTHSVKTNQIAQVSDNFTFSAAVASFGMLLRDSEHKGTASYSTVERLGKAAKGEDKEGYRKEFLELVGTVKEIEK